MPLGVEKLLPSDCLNINKFRAIHMNTYSDAHEYSLEYGCAVAQCLTRDRSAVGSSLTGVAAL